MSATARAIRVPAPNGENHTLRSIRVVAVGTLGPFGLPQRDIDRRIRAEEEEDLSLFNDFFGAAFASTADAGTDR